MSQHTAKRILVVDDSEFHVSRMRDLLSESQYEVLVSSSGKDALDLISKNHGDLDLIITDLEMPEMDGFGMLRCLKDRFPDPAIPVLVLTGAYDLTEIVDQLKEFGVVGILDKGGHSHHILTRINAVLYPEVMEKRKNDRVSVYFPAVFKKEDKSFDSFVTNISCGGCFLLTADLMRANEILTVYIKLPAIDRTMKLKGKVMWIIGGDQWHGKKRAIEGMGLQWVEVSREDRLTLEGFIEEKMKEERLISILSP